MHESQRQDKKGSKCVSGGIQSGSLECRNPVAGLLEASHLYSDMGFLKLDGLHIGLIRGSQLGFITKIFPLGDKPEEIRTHGATQIQLGPLIATLGDRLTLETAVCKPQL